MLRIILTKKTQMNLSRDPYLIFRHHDPTDTSAKDKIMGVWFHEGKERETISYLLRRVILSFTDIKAEDTTVTNEIISDEKISYGQAVSSLLSSLRIGAEGSETVTSSQSKGREKEESVDSHESVVLDKKSLQLSLLSLLQDDRFVDIIHAQYLRVVKARTANNQQPDKVKK